MFSNSILPVMGKMLAGAQNVLDPFAGIGRIHELGLNSVGVELEPEWASQHPRNITGDALNLPFADETFDAVATSPTYGNRMADSYAGDGTYRVSYRIALGRPLSERNSGAMQWGTKYCWFHEKAWREIRRTIRPYGRLVLNISDHIRGGKVQLVSAWHLHILSQIGFVLAATERVETPRMRRGANSKLRIDHENVMLFIKAAQ